MRDPADARVWHRIVVRVGQHGVEVMCTDCA
jgi:hypothetical protein